MFRSDKLTDSAGTCTWINNLALPLEVHTKNRCGPYGGCLSREIQWSISPTLHIFSLGCSLAQLLSVMQRSGEIFVPVYMLRNKILPLNYL